MINFIIERFSDGGDGHMTWEKPKFTLNNSNELNINTNPLITDKTDLSKKFCIIYTIDGSKCDPVIDKESFKVVNIGDYNDMFQQMKSDLSKKNDQYKHKKFCVISQEFDGINSYSEFPNNLIQYEVKFKNDSIICDKLIKCDWYWKRVDMCI